MILRSVVLVLLFLAWRATVLAENGVQVLLPDGVEDGARLILDSDGDVSFGPVGPTLIYYNDLSGYSSGDRLPEGAAGSVANSLGIGDVEHAGLIVSEQFALPYGKGLLVGETESCGGGKLRVVAPFPTDEWYFFQYFMFPEENQDNMVELVGPTWQIKCNWFFYGQYGYGAPPTPDIWDTVPQRTTSGGWWQRSLTSSNKGDPASNGNPAIHGWLDSQDSERWVSTPINKQMWVRTSPIPGSADGSDGFYRTANTATGLMQVENLAGRGFFHSAACTNTVVDRFTMPGHPQGFHCDDTNPANVLFSQLYYTWGSGAPARVELTDQPNYEESRRHTICTVEEWSNTRIVVSLRSGIFYQTGLECLHIHVFDMNNNYVAYAGQIDCSDEETTPGQPSPPTYEEVLR